MVAALKWLGIMIGALILAIVVFIFAVRFNDGPIAIFTGGPFKSGELTEAPDDWSFLKGRPEIEFQTMDPDTSRVVWLGVVDTRLYIVSGYMNTRYGKIWKQWPHYLEEDDHVILRIDGKLYEQRLERLMAHPQLREIMSLYAEKYGEGVLPSDVTAEQLAGSLQAGDFWLYEVVDRDS